MARDTSRFGRVLLWLAIAIAVVVGVLAVIDGSWAEVRNAAGLAMLAALVLVVGKTRSRR